MNRSIAQKVAARVLPMIRKGATVAVLGLAYKPASHVTEESAGVYIAELLSKHGARVVAYDPMSSEMELEDIRRHVVVLNSIEECLSQAEAVLITTPDPEFIALNAADFQNEWSKVAVFDFWRLLQHELAAAKHIDYFPIGRGSDDAANAERLRELWCGPADKTSSGNVRR